MFKNKIPHENYIEAYVNKFLKILSALFFASFLIITACEDDLPTQQDAKELTIESVTVSRNMETNTLHLQAHILPGEFPLDSVWFQAYQPDSADPFIEEKLYDDGTHGDMIPLNSRYSVEIDSNFIVDYLPPESDLEFRFIVYVQDISQQMLSREQIYEVQRNYPVRIDTVFFPDTVNASKSEPILFEAMVSDSNGIDDISIVQIRQTLNNGQPDTSQFFEMSNSGTYGDRIPGDNLFSASFPTGPENTIGPREMQIIATDNGNKKDTAFVEFYIKKE
ncbi:MAG: hypothetical protein MAGBODY4_00083 [Candidatus Marinimicrobia bacterium]|nr:hypothetical protein [Candidatus Neomarinimicrobiota bacterium]